MKTVWTFDTDTRPFPAKEGQGSISLIPGKYSLSGGYIDTDPMFCQLAQGILELARKPDEETVEKGTATLTAPLPDAAERTVKLMIRFYEDDYLFAGVTPVVAFGTDWELLDVSDLVEPIEAHPMGGRWVRETLTLKGSGAIFEATLAPPNEMPWDLLVDEITLECDDLTDETKTAIASAVANLKTAAAQLEGILTG